MKTQYQSILLFLTLAATAFTNTVFAANADSQATLTSPLNSPQRVAELQNLRWGMFICWSFSTFSGKEWTGGINDVSFFKATEVDTDQWARTAKEAGMGYILFLAKHHDGFCLWDTKTTDRKITKAPLGRDVLAEVKKSCDKYGIKLAIYQSESEWRWSGGLDDPSTPGPKKGNQGGSNPEMKKEQLRELLTQYGPIEYIWFDHAIGDGGLSHSETVAFVKSIQPACFVGFNSGQKVGDIRLGEMGKPGPVTIKPNGPLMAEFTYPILPKHNGGANWFYSLPKHDNLCHSAEKLYLDYLGALKYGNIFSIDVGPDYQGKLRDIDVATLRKVGEMIKTSAPAPVLELPVPSILLPLPENSALSARKSVKASSSWGEEFVASKAVDGDKSTRWSAASNANSGWLEVDLGQQTVIGRAVVTEQSFPRTQEFAIEYKDGDQWKELHRGTTIKGVKEYQFPTVTTRFVRLNIIKASGSPTIDEFEIFPPVTK